MQFMRHHKVIPSAARDLFRHAARRWEILRCAQDDTFRFEIANMKSLVIDIHAHFIPKLLYERFDESSEKFPQVKLLRDQGGEKGPHPLLGGVRMQFPGGQPTRPISPKLSDLADRRAWMDK